MQQKMQFEYPNTNNRASNEHLFHPECATPPPPLLKSFTAEDVISFAHSYVHQSKNFAIQHFIDGKIIRELNDVYDAKTNKSIKEVLEQTVAEYDDEKREMNIRILRNKLKWPEDKPYRFQVKHFINSIKRLVTLKEMKDKRIEKQVFKIALSKLPARFEINTGEYNQLHKVVQSKTEENKKPRLEFLEQLLKLKQGAMNEHEDDVKMEEVIKVQQPALQETTYLPPQQYFTQPATIRYKQTNQAYTPLNANTNYMNINANHQ
eukprot:augustus_masked-scaffold_64-processed-gene-0.25-mRNA-1 protein AED:1.00 eAED:1.00 QI:0/0/0/0/1/1/2/0/262